MKHLILIKEIHMHRTCVICKDKFQLSNTEVNMIANGEIGILDINICDDCADREAERWQEDEAIREVREAYYI